MNGYIITFSTWIMSINWIIIESIATLLATTIVALTLIYTMFNNRKIAADNNKMIEAASRAYISIYSAPLIANRNHFYIVFRNTGKSSATIKSLNTDNITRDAIKLGDKDFLDYFQNIIIAPGVSITHLATSKNYLHNHVSKFDIEYTSMDKTYKEHFEFKLDASHKLPSIGIQVLSSNDFEKNLISLIRQLVELYQDDIRKHL